MNTQEDHHSPVVVQLANEELLAEFNAFTQENILAGDGRRLFPHIAVSVQNLVPSLTYDMYLDFIDQGQYSWTGNHWMKRHGALSYTNTCNCESVQQYQAYRHRDAPNSGTFWMANPISFVRMKITSRAQDLISNEISLKAEHKYVPRIQIFQHQPSGQTNLLVHSQTFPIASFIAVTSYQNSSIVDLKISRNPFAQHFSAMSNSRRFSLFNIGG